MSQMIAHRRENLLGFTSCALVSVCETTRKPFLMYLPISFWRMSRRLSMDNSCTLMVDPRRFGHEFVGTFPSLYSHPKRAECNLTLEWIGQDLTQSAL